MKNKILGSVLGAALLAGSTVATADDLLAAENFSGNFTLTTDYTFRGTSFSNGDVAMQGGFDWGNGPWFVGTWASSQVDLDDSTTDLAGGGGTVELDFYFGWADNVGGVDLMVMPLWYTYPGQEGGSNGGRDDATFELWTSAGVGFDNLPGTPYVTLTANYSPEFFDCTYCASGDDADSALYTAINVAFALPGGWGLDFTYGHQDVGGDSSGSKVVNDFFGDDFNHTEIGLTKSAAGFDFDIRYHDNSEAKALDAWAEGKFAKDGDIEFSVSRSF